jgi:hypothetical protein
MHLSGLIEEVRERIPQRKISQTHKFYEMVPVRPQNVNVKLLVLLQIEAGRILGPHQPIESAQLPVLAIDLGASPKIPVRAVLFLVLDGKAPGLLVENRLVLHGPETGTEIGNHPGLGTGNHPEIGTGTETETGTAPDLVLTMIIEIVIDLVPGRDLYPAQDLGIMTAGKIAEEIIMIVLDPEEENQMTMMDIYPLGIYLVHVRHPVLV